jgi:hypothetical protein
MFKSFDCISHIHFNIEMIKIYCPRETQLNTKEAALNLLTFITIIFQQKSSYSTCC